MLASTLVLAACSAAAPSASATGNASTAKTCAQVAAVLSDGPDPGADPVGYALAQVRPLRAIHAANARLHGEISALADAYQQVAADDGHNAAARSAVAQASRQLHVTCPEVTP